MAAVREVPTQRGRARDPRPACGAQPAVRHGAPAGARPRRGGRRGWPGCRGRRGEVRPGGRPRRRGRTARRSGAAGRRGAGAGSCARDLGGRSRAGRRRAGALPLPRRADRRRDGRAGAAARLPRQRPRRGDAAGGRPPARARLLDQARRARGRLRLGRRDALGRGGARERRRRGHEGGGPPRVAPARARRAGGQGSGAPRAPRRRGGRVRPDRRLRRTSAGLLAARAGGSPNRVRRGARRLRPDGAPGQCGGGRERHGRGPLARVARARVPWQGQALRLHLRGRDDEGPEARDRRGVRLDRAREALHDDDDGAVPGKALSPLEHQALRPREPHVRGGDRADDGPAAVGAGRARAPRRTRAHPGEAQLDALAARGSGRDHPVGRALEAPVCVRGEAGGRGPRRARVARGHRRLHARQALRRGAGSRRIAGAPVPEPLRRSEAGPDPLRRPHLGRRADHGRRHRRTARRRPLLRHDHVDGGRRRNGVVRVVERGVGVRGGDRERHRCDRGREPRRAALAGRPRAGGRGRGRRVRRGVQVSRREGARGRGRPDARAADRLRGRARIRAPFPEPGRRAPLGSPGCRGSAPVRARAAARPAAREGPRHRRAGHGLGVEPLLVGDVLAPQAREGRLRRQVRARALRGARGEGASRRLPDGGRRAPGGGRAGRDRGASRPDV